MSDAMTGDPVLDLVDALAAWYQHRPVDAYTALGIDENDADAVLAAAYERYAAEVPT
jgi:hypothetical protein